MQIRAISRAIDTAKAIAESDTIPEDQKTQLAKHVLDAGTNATAQPLWDNWAQRIVSGGLGLIGLVLAVFVGVAVLRGAEINPAVTSALTGTIGGLAGMFTQKALGTGGNEKPAAGGSGGGDGGKKEAKADG